MLTLFSLLLHGTRKKIKAPDLVENKSKSTSQNELFEEEDQHDHTFVLSEDYGNLSEEDQDKFCIIEKAQNKSNVLDQAGIKCNNTNGNDSKSVIEDNQSKNKVKDIKTSVDENVEKNDSAIFRNILSDLVPTLPSEYFDLDENGVLPDLKESELPQNNQIHHTSDDLLENKSKNSSEDIGSNKVKEELKEDDKVTIEDVFEDHQNVKTADSESTSFNEFVVENVVKLLNDVKSDELSAKTSGSVEEIKTDHSKSVSEEENTNEETSTENEISKGEHSLLKYLDLINDEQNNKDKSNDGNSSKGSKSPTLDNGELSFEDVEKVPKKNDAFLNELDAVLARYNQEYGKNSEDLVKEKSVELTESILPIKEEIFTKHTTLELEEDDVIFNELDAVLEKYNQNSGIFNEVSMDMANDGTVHNQTVLSIREEVFTKHSVETALIEDDVIFNELDAVLEKYDIIENDLVQSVVETVETIDIAVEIEIHKNDSQEVIDNNDGEEVVSSENESENSTSSMEKYECLLHDAESSIKKLVAMSTEESDGAHDNSYMKDGKLLEFKEERRNENEIGDMKDLDTSQKYNELLRKVSVPCLDDVEDINDNDNVFVNEPCMNDAENRDSNVDNSGNCKQATVGNDDNSKAKDISVSSSENNISQENNLFESDDDFGRSFEGREQKERISWGDSMDLSQDDEYEDFMTKETNYRTILLVCIDSNQKFLNRRKLWTLDETTYKSCETIDDVRHVVAADKYPDLKYIFIHTGTTDIESKSGSQVHDELLDVISFIRHEYSTIKIILSQVTPRTDERDKEVKACNCLIDTSLGHLDHITVLNHDYLRNANGSYYYDEKHIHKNAIWRFAANIKRGLREAYGITFDGHKRKRDNRDRDRDRKMVGRRKLYRFNSASDIEKASREKVNSDKQRSQSLVLLSQREPK